MANKRNSPCPCGSGKKFKKCCNNPVRLRNLELAAWLKRFDPDPVLDYATILVEELDTVELTKALQDRKNEILPLSTFRRIDRIPKTLAFAAIAAMVN